MGDEAQEVYYNFNFVEDAVEDKMKFPKIMEMFVAYCIPKRSVTFERHRFFTCVGKN